jgi:predicted alpha/beta hydrolase family esterase
MDTTIIIPGLHGSDVSHWQSWIQRRIPNAVRVIQNDWSRPSLTDWTQQVYRRLDEARGRVWLVAHSFGCLVAVKAAADEGSRIAGAMLVAPADPDKFGIAEVVPDGPLDFPSVAVVSSNDPWMELKKATRWAEAWGSRIVNIGAAGHINVASGHGPWPDGLEIFEALKRHAAPTFEHAAFDESIVELGDF